MLKIFLGLASLVFVSCNQPVENINERSTTQSVSSSSNSSAFQSELDRLINMGVPLENKGYRPNGLLLINADPSSALKYAQASIDYTVTITSKMGDQPAVVRKVPALAEIIDQGCTSIKDYLAKNLVKNAINNVEPKNNSFIASITKGGYTYDPTTNRYKYSNGYSNYNVTSFQLEGIYLTKPCEILSEIVDFKAGAGSLAGSIDISFYTPANIQEYGAIDLYRSIGTTAPVGCSSTTSSKMIWYEKNFLGKENTKLVVNDVLPSGSKASYRLCLKDRYGTVFKSYTAAGIESNSAAIKIVTRLDRIPNSAVVNGDYLYVAESSGLSVYRVSATTPQLVKRVSLDDAEAYTLQVKGTNLLVATSKGLVALNLKNPAAPMIMNKIEGLVSNRPHAIAFVNENYAVFASGKLSFIKFEEKGRITLTSQSDDGKLSGVSILGDVAYGVSDSESSIQIYTVNDSGISKPVMFASEAVSYAVASSGNYLYVGGNNGLYVYDVSLRKNPIKKVRLLDDVEIEHLRLADGHLYTWGKWGIVHIYNTAQAPNLVNLNSYAGDVYDTSPIDVAVKSGIGYFIGDGDEQGIHTVQLNSFSNSKLLKSDYLPSARSIFKLGGQPIIGHLIGDNEDPALITSYSDEVKVFGSISFLTESNLIALNWKYLGFYSIANNPLTPKFQFNVDMGSAIAQIATHDESLIVKTQNTLSLVDSFSGTKLFDVAATDRYQSLALDETSFYYTSDTSLVKRDLFTRSELGTYKFSNFFKFLYNIVLSGESAYVATIEGVFRFATSGRSGLSLMGKHSANAWRVYVKDDKNVLVGKHDGLELVDFSNPASPVKRVELPFSSGITNIQDYDDYIVVFTNSSASYLVQIQQN